MNIFEVNKNTLMSLYERFPSSFDGLSLKGTNLVYQDQSVDISTFNINELLAGNSLFTSSLGTLSPLDVFKIIKLHVDFLGGNGNES